jgi:DnaJ-class molecular chaperone
MGDAADDAYDAAERWHSAVQAMRDAGCRPCHVCRGTGSVGADADECPHCGGAQWIDKNGNPTEM